MSTSLVVGFEDYLKQQEITIEKAYQSIPDYTDTLPISNKTRRNYNQKLRNFIEYVYNQQGIVLEHDPRTILKISKE